MNHHQGRCRAKNDGRCRAKNGEGLPRYAPDERRGDHMLAAIDMMVQGSAYSKEQANFFKQNWTQQEAFADHGAPDRLLDTTVEHEGRSSWANVAILCALSLLAFMTAVAALTDENSCLDRVVDSARGMMDMLFKGGQGQKGVWKVVHWKFPW